MKTLFFFGIWRVLGKLFADETVEDGIGDNIRVQLEVDDEDKQRHA